MPLLVGLSEVARRTASPLRLLELGASAGLNLLVDRFRYGQAYGPVASPCRLPAPGTALGPLRIADRAGCDRAPLDPTTDEGRLRLRSSIWGDQPERLARLDGALEVASRERFPVEQASAAEWLSRQLTTDPTTVTVAWHSIVRMYVDPAEWTRVEDLTVEQDAWRLAYEPDVVSRPHEVALRLHGPGTDEAGEVLGYGGAHGWPLVVL